MNKFEKRRQITHIVSNHKTSMTSWDFLIMNNYIFFSFFGILNLVSRPSCICNACKDILFPSEHCNWHIRIFYFIQLYFRCIVTSVMLLVFGCWAIIKHSKSFISSSLSIVIKTFCTCPSECMSHINLKPVSIFIPLTHCDHKCFRI